LIWDRKKSYAGLPGLQPTAFFSMMRMKARIPFFFKKISVFIRVHPWFIVFFSLVRVMLFLVRPERLSGDLLTLQALCIEGNFRFAPR
jgi:hypothetical protein